MATICVSLQVTTTPGLVPSHTVAEPCSLPKPEPAIVTCVPAPPEMGDTRVITGGAAGWDTTRVSSATARAAARGVPFGLAATVYAKTPEVTLCSPLSQDISQNAPHGYSGGFALIVTWLGNASCTSTCPRCRDESMTYE